MITKSKVTSRLGHDMLRRLLIGTGGLVVVGCFAISYALSPAAH